ncbi:hypothetical protein P3T36_006958 [Kitasatospora sp. MAP12-15]|uniref:alpha-L-fucosidase n=1 Tax=unclassified Kitasatospora TaxID=2633591 RepID=UPI002473D24F|nr:alpha-L-fucosidase [Kitasatospora sp. MAP12-44]MDH6115390.1 hypothetical protein [Kitasatospora sp. MAP12-44]
MSRSISRRSVLTGLAVATVATVIRPGGAVAEAAVVEAAVVEGDPLPLVPLRIPQLDQGAWQQPDSKIQWMRDNKLAMFIHWGVYSAPAQGEWYMFGSQTQPTAYRAKYAASFATQSQSYNPTAWAQLAKDLGAAQVVLTTRHHEGFALWPSGHPNAWPDAAPVFAATSPLRGSGPKIAFPPGLKAGIPCEDRGMEVFSS